MVAYYYAQDSNGWHCGIYVNGNDHWYLTFQNYCSGVTKLPWWVLNNCPEEIDITFCYAMNRMLSPNRFSAPFRFQQDQEDLTNIVYLFDFAPSMVLTAPRNWGPTWAFWGQDPLEHRLRHNRMANILLYDGHVSSFPELDVPPLVW